MTAAERVLLAYVTSDDMRRRLTHLTRLAELNGHDDTAEALRIVADLTEHAQPEEQSCAA